MKKKVVNVFNNQKKTTTLLNILIRIILSSNELYISSHLK